MNVVVVSCPACFDQAEVPASCMAVAESTAEPGDKAADTDISWVCLACRTLVSRRISRSAGSVLVTGGGWCIDASAAEYPHPEDPPGGQPFTMDDLLDFHEMLTDQ